MYRRSRETPESVESCVGERRFGYRLVGPRSGAAGVDQGAKEGVLPPPGIGHGHPAVEDGEPDDSPPPRPYPADQCPGTDPPGPTRLAHHRPAAVQEPPP